MGGPARIERQPAFVLHRRAYRESSLLLDVLTRDHGRIGLVARSARASKKGQGSLLQPFQSLLVSWSGRGDLKTLTAVERAEGLPLIAGERLYSALYINELLVRALAAADAHEPVFEAYAALLPGLAESPDHEPLLREFELRLLRELGYALDLAYEASGGECLEPAAHYAFDPAMGFVPQPVDLDATHAFPGWALLSIGRGDYADVRTRKLAKRLLREALAAAVGDRPLRSREYFRGAPAPVSCEPDPER